MQLPTYLETAELLGMFPQQLALLDRFLCGHAPTDLKAEMSVLQCAAAAIFKRINSKWDMRETTALTFIVIAKPVIEKFSKAYEFDYKPVCHLSMHDRRYLMLHLYSDNMTTGFCDTQAAGPGEVLEKLKEHCETIEMTDMSVMLLRFFGRLKAYRTNRKAEKPNACNDVTAASVSGTDGKSRIVRHDITGAPD